MKGHTLTRVEENNGTQAAQLRLVHLHVLHFRYQLCQDSAGDRTHRAQESCVRKTPDASLRVHYRVRMSPLS